MHWACEKCIVRACCTEDCYQTKLFDPLCIDCKKIKTCKERCSSALFSEGIRRLNQMYDLGAIMTHDFKETSVLYKFINMKEKGKEELWTTHAKIAL